jgi:hypothetical protein
MRQQKKKKKHCNDCILLIRRSDLGEENGELAMQWHARDSDFSNCHPPTIYLLSAGVELVSAITLWPLVGAGVR